MKAWKCDRCKNFFQIDYKHCYSVAIFTAHNEDISSNLSLDLCEPCYCDILYYLEIEK